MKVRVRLFAAARQMAGRESIEVEVPGGATVADLRRRLGEDVPAIAPLLPAVLFAIDHRYAADATAIPADVAVACIPPVSGG